MSGLAVAILAAGRSARFGAEDKLTAMFRGMPLGLHTAHAILGLKFAHRWVIVRAHNHPCASAWVSAGFEPVVNANADMGMGASLRIAAERAQQAGTDGLMICLADMPLVPADHFQALIGAWNQHGGIVASQDGARISPPAIFAQEHYAAVAGLTGDRGGKMLLKDALCVPSLPGALVDVDDLETLERLSGEGISDPRD